MRKPGRRANAISETERQFIEEFLHNDLSYEEMANKMGLTKAQLRYRVTKYLKKKDEEEKERKQAEEKSQHTECEGSKNSEFAEKFKERWKELQEKKSKLESSS